VSLDIEETLEYVDLMLKAEGLPAYTEIITLLNYWNRHKPDTMFAEMAELLKRIDC